MSQTTCDCNVTQPSRTARSRPQAGPLTQPVDEEGAVADAVVGIVANPLSGRDIRRLVAQASVFPTAEKAAMVQRMLSAFGAVGVDQVLVNTDLGGISAAVLRAVRRGPPRGAEWPEVEFLDEDPIAQTADDTTNAVRRMVTAGARVVVCLGGDGTARVAAAACGETPLLALSTGTNNTFPAIREATVAGLAAGLLAVAAVGPEVGVRRATALEVTAGGRVELALVDVCVSTAQHVGARALWDPAALTELFCTFAEPDAVGLSSVAGLICPSMRSERRGVALLFAPVSSARYVVQAPIAPGLVLPVGVDGWRRLDVGEEIRIATQTGVLAVDGEREIEFGPGSHPRIRLRGDGPRCVDVPAVMAAAAAHGLVRRVAHG